MAAEQSNERRALRIVERLLDTPTDARGDLLNDLCGEDQDLRTRVTKLLAHSDDDIELTGFAQVLAAVDETGAATDSRIGSYQIVRRIGRGGMGEVFEARQQDPERTVAIKVLRDGLFGAGARQRFAAEARLLAHLQHPCIAQVIEAGLHIEDVAIGRRELPFLVLEYIEGARTIVEHANQRELSLRDRLSLLIEVASAVHHGHQMGVIHRDLKPANLLVGADGRPKVIDFGVAKATSDELLQFPSMTSDGQVIGTLGYIAPETLTGEVEYADVRADVYALGAVGYQLAAGRMPFELEGVAFAEAVRRVTATEPARPDSLDADLAAVLLQALARSPADRYGSALAFADDLQRWIANEPVRARRPSAVRAMLLFTRRNPPLAIALLTILVLIVGGSAAFVAVERNARQQTDRSAYRSSIVGANALVQIGEIAQANETLRAAPEWLRAWEWRFLEHKLDSSIARTTPFPELPVERGNLDDLDYAPESDLLLAGNDRGQVRLMRRATGEVVSEWRVDGDARFVRMVGGPGRALVAGIDAPCRLLDCTTGAVDVLHDASSINMIAVTADGRTGACAAAKSAFRDGYVDCFDLTTGKRTHHLEGERSPYTSIALTPDGRFVFAGRFDGRIDYWDLHVDGDPVRTLLQNERHARHNNLVNHLAVSPDGSRLAASGGSVLTVWQLDPIDLLAVINASAVEIALPSSDRLLVAQRGERSLVEAPIRDGILRSGSEGFGHVGYITRICVDDEHDRIVTSGQDGIVRTWDRHRLGPQRVLRHRGSVRDVTATRNGQHAVTVTSKGDVVAWDIATGEQLVTSKVEGGLKCALPLPSPDRALLVGSGLHVLDIGEQTLEPMAGINGAFVAGAVSRNGRILALARDDGTVLVVRDGEQLADRSFSDHGGALRLAMHPSEDLVLVGTENGTLIECHTFDLSTATDVGKQDDVEDLAYLPFAPHDIVTASANDMLLLHERRGDTFALREIDRGYRIHRLAVHPHEQRLFACSTNGDIAVWNTATWSKLLSVRGHRAITLGACFAPELDALLTCSMDRTAKVWRTK